MVANIMLVITVLIAAMSVAAFTSGEGVTEP